MKLRYYILALLLLFGLAPLILAVLINLPLVVERTAIFYQKAYLQNLRADFRDLDQHLASRNEIIRLLAKLPDPGVLLGTHHKERDIDLARARYTGWINQMLSDQTDIIQIRFFDAHGQERFWLERDRNDRLWHPTTAPPEPPGADFIDAAAQLAPAEVMVSRIRVNPPAASLDPRQLLTLKLTSLLGAPSNPGGGALGLLVMTIDVGGLAQLYRDTLWVRHNGSYLLPGQPIDDRPRAFADFPGLEQVFAERKLALAQSISGEPYLWVPMFQTEDALPLWVGRPVDSSPIEDFRNALIARVLSIVLVLVLVVMAMARAIARLAERFGRELTAGVRHILREGQPLRLAWRGPSEVRELGEQLSALSRSHAEHIATERQHTRELEKSNRYKSEFLANVSHELRTPLNAILLLSKMLADRESGLDGEQRRQAQVIHEASRDLRGMIDNILDISRIEAGQVAMDLEWVDVPSTLSELLSLTEPMFTTKGLHLELTIAPEAPRRLYSDRGKIRQIIKNFLANAAKFTDQGQVILAAEIHDDPRHPLAISVTDTGIGIAPGKEGIIFDAFQQADGSTRRRYGGTGLGLSISRELAGLLHGKIAVSSQLGQGSRFCLLLPLSMEAGADVPDTPPPATSTLDAPLGHSAQADPPPALPSPVALSGLNGQWILILERDIANLLALSALFEHLGLRAQTAADVDEALETLHDEPDCALMLLGCTSPGATGQAPADPTCDSIARIRDDPGFGGLPLVVMGAPSSAARAAYRDAGASAVLEKPPNAGELIELIDRLLGAQH